MNAYFFTGILTSSGLRPESSAPDARKSFQTQDHCASLIVFGESREEAQQRFEAWLLTPPEGENELQAEIRKIAAGQFIDQLFTESGNVPLIWPDIFQQTRTQVESLAVDDFEQGYWAEVDALVRPENLSASIEDLQHELPEDISSGLNWSANRQFIFILSILSPPPSPIDFTIPLEPGASAPQESEESNDENPDAPDPVELQNLLETFPQGADKEAAAIVQARNSVVAGWLWRRYAAGKQLATLPIRIEPTCGILGYPDPEQKGEA